MNTSIDLLIANSRQVCIVPAQDGGPQRGSALGTLGIVTDGAVAIADGRIVAAGPEDRLRESYDPAETLDAGGGAIVPGFVDPHTHALWAGDRVDEFEMRLAGATYMEIMAAGGGINNTVGRVRAASVDELVEQTRPRLERMLRCGTTTVEIKTGYGLTTESECKMLDAIYCLADTLPIGRHGDVPGRARHPARI